MQAFVSAAGLDAVVSNGNAVVWQFTKVGIIPGGSISRTLAPGETATYSFSWDQTNLQGVAAPSGKYTIKAWWLSSSINGTVINDPQSQLSTSAIQLTVQ